MQAINRTALSVAGALDDSVFDAEIDSLYEQLERSRDEPSREVLEGSIDVFLPGPETPLYWQVNGQSEISLYPLKTPQALVERVDALNPEQRVEQANSGRKSSLEPVTTFSVASAASARPTIILGTNRVVQESVPASAGDINRLPRKTAPLAVTVVKDLDTHQSTASSAAEDTLSAGQVKSDSDMPSLTPISNALTAGAVVSRDVMDDVSVSKQLIQPNLLGTDLRANRETPPVIFGSAVESADALPKNPRESQPETRTEPLRARSTEHHQTLDAVSLPVSVLTNARISVEPESPAVQTRQANPAPSVSVNTLERRIESVPSAVNDEPTPQLLDVQIQRPTESRLQALPMDSVVDGKVLLPSISTVLTAGPVVSRDVMGGVSTTKQLAQPAINPVSTRRRAESFPSEPLLVPTRNREPQPETRTEPLRTRSTEHHQTLDALPASVSINATIDVEPKFPAAQTRQANPAPSVSVSTLDRHIESVPSTVNETLTPQPIEARVQRPPESRLQAPSMDPVAARLPASISINATINIEQKSPAVQARLPNPAPSVSVNTLERRIESVPSAENDEPTPQPLDVQVQRPAESRLQAPFMDLVVDGKILLQPPSVAIEFASARQPSLPEPRAARQEPRTQDRSAEPVTPVTPAAPVVSANPASSLSYRFDSWGDGHSVSVSLEHVSGSIIPTFTPSNATVRQALDQHLVASELNTWRWSPDQQQDGRRQQQTEQEEPDDE